MGPWPRLGARIIDGLVLLIPNLIIGAALTDGSGGPAGIGGGDDFAYLLVTTLLGYAYAVWLEASRGQTVGKMAVGIKVIGPDGRLPSNDVALRRNGWLLFGLVPIVGGVLSFVAAVAIGVTISNDPFKRGTHDNFAGGSAVVRAR
ncbi:MAG TPA: RDD family protein [Nocardioides sp.]|nr:RDD family protein [Nocardioides sp.]